MNSPAAENEAMINTALPTEDDDYDEEAEADEDDEDDESNEQDEVMDEDKDEEYESDIKPATRRRKPTTTREPATTTRKIGGSRKGRHCHRWTPAQQNAVVKHMLAIHAEGEITGDETKVECHKRLIAEYGDKWNHTVSGIQNAWHRRGLARRVKREELLMKAQQEVNEAEEDKKLGIKPDARRRPRVSPALEPEIQKFPTVIVSFKHRSNDKSRNRSFENIDTMVKFWSQAAVSEVFPDISNFMVLAAAIGDSGKALLMAPGDKGDYDELVERIARAVESAGEVEVRVHVRAGP